MSALPQSSPNAQGQAAPGEFGPACGEQTHALARTAAAKPGAAWPWALGEVAPAHSLCIACFGKAFGVVGQLLGEPDFFGEAFSAQEWSWHTLAESKSAQPTRAVW